MECAGASSQISSIDYFTDTLLRANPQTPSAAGAAAAGGVTSGGATATAPDDRAMHAQVGHPDYGGGH